MKKIEIRRYIPNTRVPRGYGKTNLVPWSILASVDKGGSRKSDWISPHSSNVLD